MKVDPAPFYRARKIGQSGKTDGILLCKILHFAEKWL